MEKSAFHDAQETETTIVLVSKRIHASTSVSIITPPSNTTRRRALARYSNSVRAPTLRCSIRKRVPQPKAVVPDGSRAPQISRSQVRVRAKHSYFWSMSSAGNQLKAKSRHIFMVLSSVPVMLLSVGEGAVSLIVLKMIPCTLSVMSSSQKASSADPSQDAS